MRLIGAGPDLRWPSMKGRYTVVRGANGYTIRAAPRKKKSRISDLQAYQMDKFRQATEAMKYISTLDRLTAEETSNKLAILWRDWLMMCLYGRIVRINIRNYGEIVPAGSRQDASRVLDGIGVAPGTMLFRGPDLWMPVTPGNVGDFLRYNGTARKPEWVPAPSQALHSTFIGGPAASAYTTGRCFVGTIFRVDKPLEVRAVWQLLVAAVGSRKYKPVIGGLTVGGSFPVSWITIGPEMTATHTLAGTYWEQAHFAFPVVVPPTELCFAGLMRTDGTGTTTQDSVFTTTGGQQLPGISMTNGNAASFNTLTPTVGTVPTFPTGTWPIGLEWT